VAFGLQKNILMGTQFGWQSCCELPNLPFQCDFSELGGVK
jgi:hypothetical protein